MITVVADGYVSVEKTKVAVDGISSLVEVELQPKPALITLRTEDGARVSVDGRPVTSTPTGQLQISAGKHLIAILRNGREAFATEIVVDRGETRTLDAPLEKTGRRKAVPWVLGGAGVLAAGAITTGILTGIHDGNAEELRNDIEAGNQPAGVRLDYENQVDKRDRYRTATWVLGGAAVTAGAIGVLLYLFDSPSSESIRLTPSVAPGSAGVTLSGPL